MYQHIKVPQKQNRAGIKSDVTTLGKSLEITVNIRHELLARSPMFRFKEQTTAYFAQNISYTIAERFIYVIWLP